MRVIKNILLLSAYFGFALTMVSCTQGKRVIEPEEIPGDWKTLQAKISPKQPLHDVGNCDGDTTKWKGDIYTFKEDGSFSTKDICSGKISKDTKCKWKYKDNVLTLNFNHENKDVKTVFSVVDMGDGKVKFSHIFSDWNFDDGSMLYTPYYYVMQKQ